MIFKDCLVGIVIYLYSSKDNKEIVSQCFCPDLPNYDDVAIRAIGIPTISYFNS